MLSDLAARPPNVHDNDGGGPNQLLSAISSDAIGLFAFMKQHRPSEMTGLGMLSLRDRADELALAEFSDSLRESGSASARPHNSRAFLGNDGLFLKSPVGCVTPSLPCATTTYAVTPE